jgi:hypothetical protein
MILSLQFQDNQIIKIIINWDTTFKWPGEK